MNVFDIPQEILRSPAGEVLRAPESSPDTSTNGWVGAILRVSTDWPIIEMSFRLSFLPESEANVTTG